MARLPMETLVLIDFLLERGVEPVFLGDNAVELERLRAAAKAGLLWGWADRSRGLRRRWLRDPRDFEPLRPVHIGYEPRLERPLGVKGRQTEQIFYWPRRLI